MNEKLIMDLHRIGAVKFGTFTLKSGMISPIYIDLRILVSFPEVLSEVSKLMSDMVIKLRPELIAGIPYTALPIATAVSLETKVPLIYIRKEQKDYGTKKLIEGNYEKGQTCVVIDDLITLATSKFEIITPLEAEGLVIKDIIVLVDREQGGKSLLKERGYDLHAVITIHELLETLRAKSKITKEDYKRSLEFIEKNVVKK